MSEAPVPPLAPAIRSVYGGLDLAGTAIVKILVATQSSEVYELSKVPTLIARRRLVDVAGSRGALLTFRGLWQDTGSWTLLAEGHYSPAPEGPSGELWGLAPHPTKADLFATAGDDGTVRVWSIAQGRLLRKCQLDGPSRCLAWSPSGRRLLVGLGGSARGLRHRKDGAFCILDADTLDLVYEGRDARHWLREVRYSPDGDTFALACSDGKIYLYDAKQNVLRAKCDKHNAAVTALDFSDDGAYLQSDGADYEHLYFAASDGAFFKLPTQLRSVKWGTWTCRMGWCVQGCWPKNVAGKQFEDLMAAAAAEGRIGIAAVAPEPVSVHRSKARDLIAAGYQDGRIKVFRHPCLSKAADALPLHGHTADVRVRFTCDDNYMLSVGYADRSILIWKITRH